MKNHDSLFPSTVRTEKNNEVKEKKEEKKEEKKKEETKKKKTDWKSLVQYILVVVILTVVVFFIVRMLTRNSENHISRDSYSAPAYTVLEAEELSLGSHIYELNEGEMTGLKKIPGNCVYNVISFPDDATFIIYYDDGTVVDFSDGIDKTLPIKVEPKIRIAALKKMRLEIRIMPRTKI